LPWLIRLDREIEGQHHGGISDLVVRSNHSRTSLNEAVALELLDAAGLASQEAAPTAFSVNGGTPVLRLIIEHPDDTWQAANFVGPGALYKAESTGDWSYRGEDPDAYQDIFDQEAGEDVADLAPLTGFLRFLDESDDATFAAELPSRLDVDAFARYLAMMDLVENFDDIDGPGNNAYLHWDAASGRFTVVPWDMNLAFGGFGGMRGVDGPGDEGGPRVFRFDPTDPDASFDPSQLPDGVRLPDGGEGGIVRIGPGGRMRENPLVSRFRAVPAFEAAYQAQLTALRAELFDSGRAQAILDAWTGVLSAGATDLVDAATITTEAAALAERFSPAA
jgi:spore coat protein CotH